MILYTLGTIFYPFDRAVDWLDQLITTGIINEPVILQHGSTSTENINHPLIESSVSLSAQEIRQAARDASLVISHAGQGSTRMLTEIGASFLLLPRLKSYGEHIDDHQLRFAQAVSEFGIPFCLKYEDLMRHVLNPPKPCLADYLNNRPPLVEHLLARYGRGSMSPEQEKMQEYELTPIKSRRHFMNRQ